MPDPLHPSERALIDAAVAEGRVTTCAPGAACAGLYDERSYRQRHKDAMRAGKANRGAQARRESAEPAVMRRRKAVAELVALGQRAPEIAHFLGASVKTIRNDMREIGGSE